MSDMVTMDEVEETADHSRRAFLTRGAVGVAAAMAGSAVLTTLTETPAFAVTGGVVLFDPVRVYDSRGGTVSGSGTTGIFTRGNSARTILFGKDPGTDIIPDGSLGAVITLTVTGTVSFGALAVTAASVSSTGVSNINWFASGQTLANSMVVPVSAVSTGSKGNSFIPGVNVHCVGGTGGVSKTNFIIDCSGYISA